MDSEHWFKFSPTAGIVPIVFTRTCLGENPAEHLGWDGVNLVQDHYAPLLLLDPLHRLLGLPASLL